MKVYYLIAFWFLGIAHVCGQTITLPNLEASFLSNNYLLIASKYDIDISEAEIVQEKLWNNPTIHLSEFNLWKTTHVEQMPYLFGSFGASQQFSVALEQLIETAGKRRKRVAIKELAKNSTAYAYEELLLELLKTLRQTYFSLARIQEEKQQLDASLELFVQLKLQYQRQSELNNVSQADYYRIQAELIGLQKEKVELENDQTELLNTLRVLTQMPNMAINDIDFSAFQRHSRPIPIILNDLTPAKNIRLKRQQNEVRLAEKELVLAKAQRIPDLTVQVDYDRGGNIMLDFVGIGLSMDLPVFNTNKGGIKAAQLAYEQEKVAHAAVQSELTLTVERLQQQIRRLEKALSDWKAEHTQDQLSLIDNYKKHVLSQQITLLEFIDFMQAYRASQKAYLELMESYQATFEELIQIVGRNL